MPQVLIPKVCVKNPFFCFNFLKEYRKKNKKIFLSYAYMCLCFWQSGRACLRARTHVYTKNEKYLGQIMNGFKIIHFLSKDSYLLLILLNIAAVTYQDLFEEILKKKNSRKTITKKQKKKD